MPPPVEEGRSSRSENATEFLPNGGESFEFLLSPPSSPLPRSSKSLRLLNDDDRELSGERLPNILACGVSCRNAPPVARLPSPADARDADANDSRWLPPFELARPLGGESPGVSLLLSPLPSLRTLRLLSLLRFPLPPARSFSDFALLFLDPPGVDPSELDP